jgi:xanthine dehydrogenase FAD-binding subunit
MLTCDEYLMPGSLAEAFDLIERHRGAYRLVAGASDLLAYAREGRGGDLHVPALIDLTRVAELGGFERRGSRIVLGANTTIGDFLACPALRAATPVMRHCAGWFADDQIRAQATLVGNLVNASPAADGLPPMLALNATVTFRRRVGVGVEERTVPVEAFMTGPGRTCLPPDAIVTAIECDVLDGYGTAFEKVGHRRSLVISTVCLAALVQVDGASGRLTDVRLALAAVGPVPQRLRAIERRLVGQPADRPSIEAAVREPGDWVQSRTRQAYRREVVRNFIVRGLVNALAEIGMPAGGSTTEEAQHV